MKTWLLVLAILCCTILFLIIELRTQPTKLGFAVCAGPCLKSVAFGKDSELITPLVDGKPDYRRGILSHAVVTVDHSYERIELRSAQ